MPPDAAGMARVGAFWRTVRPMMADDLRASPWVSAALYRYFYFDDLDAFPRCLALMQQECARLEALLGDRERAWRPPPDGFVWPTRKARGGRPLTVAQLRALQYAAGWVRGLTRSLADVLLTPPTP